MRDRLPPLDWLRTFEAAARLNSFAAAAEELGMTQASTSHHIRSLEKWLGAALFERLPRSVQLTEIGSGYLPAVRRALNELSDATVDLFGRAARRSITIQAPAAFATLWLAPRLHRFVRTYPQIELRLQTLNWPGAGTDDEIDIDIRYGDGTWPGFTSQLLLEEPAVLVCSPALGRGKGTMTTLSDLGDTPFIHILGTGDLWREIGKTAGMSEAERTWLNDRKLIKVDSSLAALELAVSGLGAALVLRCFAASYLKDGRLISPLPLQAATGQAHFIVAPASQRSLAPEMLACRDWLLAEAQSGPDVTRIESREPNVNL
ncbi:MAG TPA: LysR substrate-binding domain-containing protein [Dongiaceae bacterium]|nr:LysR substrate-binding domain-containing protein [Dongiaceae bacterium]